MPPVKKTNVPKKVSVPKKVTKKSNKPTPKVVATDTPKPVPVVEEPVTPVPVAAPTDTGYLLLMMMTSSLNFIYTITNNVSIIDHRHNIPGLGSR